MCRTIAYKDTDWNRERVRRNLTYETIAKRFHVSKSTASRWFSGAVMPTTDEIAELCRWFTELDPEHKIDFEIGKLFFEEISNKYVAERAKTAIMTNGKVQRNESHRRGKIPKTEIGKVLWRKEITFEELSKKTGLGISLLKSRFQGVYMPSDSEIILICDAIEYDVEKAEELFRQAYNERHEVNGQMDISEAREINDKMNEMPFEIADSNEEISMPPELEKALEDRTRFVKWSELYNKTLFARIDIVAHLMYLYTEWDYNMYNAIEALAQEHKNIPFWVLRTLILEAERVNYFGEYGGLYPDEEVVS